MRQTLSQRPCVEPLHISRSVETAALIAFNPLAILLPSFQRRSLSHRSRFLAPFRPEPAP